MPTSPFAAVAAAACLLALAALPASAARRGNGESCTSNSDCLVANAECINNVCNCNSSDVLVGTKCLLPVGGRCDSRPCDADNSQCISGFCSCINGYLQAYNNTFCYKVPRYDEYCEKDNDCQNLTEESVCEKNRCRCSKDMAWDNNKCKKKIDQLGVHCLKETEVCYLERDGQRQNVECRNQICTCKEGIKASKDNMSCGAGTLEAISVGVSLIAFLLLKEVLA